RKGARHLCAAFAPDRLDGMRSPVTCFLLFTLSASAQELAFEKYRLENGMQVILHEDHSLPVVCVNIWYGVGSGDEAPGRSGFAHLFEHLMFMGTERTPGSSFDDWMEAGGGWNNASTSKDRTNYFSVGPSNLLPLLLWLEADRLEALGSSMTQEKLDRQREVVRNERRENTEMRPYGRAYLEIDKLMYPPGHPYHTSVIGSHEHLEAATLKDVKDFFARYYVPNNASLVVAGDFDPQDIKPRIAAWFGTLPRRPEVPRKKMAAVELREVRRLTLTDRVQFPRISIIYHSPPFFAPGDAAMDLVAAILAGGKSSRLYERLVYTDKLATEVSAYQASRRLGSLFHIVVTARPGVSLDRIEGVVDEELGEFLARGPSEDELERRKAALEYESVSALQSLRTKADRLNLYNFHLGTPNGFRYDLDRYRRATTDTVRKWAIKMLNRRARLILRVLPEPKVQIRPRAERPDSLATKPFLPQAPEVFELSNGLEVRHWERRELPRSSSRAELHWIRRARRESAD
ncbi:MAG: M16 family metallopeptidase, partial [Planctomycetota bacterium]